MNRRKLTFITGNVKKAEQLRLYLTMPIEHTNLDLLEIQTTDPSLVTKHKMREAFKKLHRPIIVDDNSLVIKSMGLLPGTLIKWFEQELGYEKICRLTDTFGDRKATAFVHIGYTDGNDEKVFIGEITGVIAEHPRGTGGFGWDVIFIPDGYSQTRAEMNETDYDATSPRRVALEKLARYLEREETTFSS